MAKYFVRAEAGQVEVVVAAIWRTWPRQKGSVLMLTLTEA